MSKLFNMLLQTCKLIFTKPVLTEMFKTSSDISPNLD